jgi:hypothetical protein
MGVAPANAVATTRIAAIAATTVPFVSLTGGNLFW